MSRFRCPRPPGYAATTWTHVGGIKVITLLDTCATSSGISEELACLFVSYFDAAVDAGKMSAEEHPVKGISKYDEASGMQGVGGEVMETRFSVCLRLEFVGIDKRVGDKANPRQQISFKVFPKGRSNVDGLIIGMPVLDKMPFGMEMINMDTCWYLKRLDVQMRKAEAHDRLRYKRDVEAWNREPQIGRSAGKDSFRSIAESCSHIKPAQRLLGLCCVYNGEDEPIEPGWGGLVPCKWTGPLLKKPCLAEVLEDDLGANMVGLDVTPGICDPLLQGRDTMVGIQNNGPLPITIDRGQVIAVGQAMPPGLVWVRRDVDPETGKEPEVLYTDDSGDLCTMSLDESYCPELTEATLQAEAQSQKREECRFDKAQGLPMYQTDDQALAWKPVPEHDAVSQVSTAASSLDSRASNGVESYKALASGDIKVGDARTKAFDVCRHLVQNEDLISQIFGSELPPEEYYVSLGQCCRRCLRVAIPTWLSM